MTLIKSISGIRGTIGGPTGDTLNPLDIVKFTTAYAKMFQHKEHLKADGFKFDNKHGWYKKVPAKAQREIGQSLKAKYAVEPKFRGSL